MISLEMGVLTSETICNCFFVLFSRLCEETEGVAASREGRDLIGEARAYVRDDLPLVSLIIL